jgi:lysophospholipase L1-like esterase
MRLVRLLGDGFTVVEEGFNGRTCVYDDPIEGGYKSGAAYLPPCLMSHSPLDLVIIMLGTNDAKKRFGLTPMTVGEGMMQLIRLTRLYAVDAQGNPPKVLIIAPPPILDTLMRSRHGECFGEQAIAVTKGLAAEYARIAKLLRCEFFDAAGWAEVSPIDAVHLTKEGHLGLADGLARKIQQILI